MIFLQPWAWGLLGLAVGVAVLYFLRRREEERRVSAIWLWTREAERPRSALSFLWTKIGLLLLQLAALLGLVFALAMPFLSHEIVGGGNLVIVIDGSASMQARDGTTTRYERARALAIEQIERLRPQKIAVIQAQREPRLLMPFSADRNAVLRALQQARPSLQADASWSALMQLLLGLGERSQITEILYISDRPPEEREKMRWLPVGSNVPNLAITGLAARPLPEAPTRLALWSRVENFSDKTLDAQIRLFADDKEIFRQSISVEPGKAHHIETWSALAQRFVARLDADDSFSHDNERYFLLPAPKTLRILWLGERNFFLERALALYAQPRFEFLKALERESVAPEAFDLIVAHNIHLPALGSGRWLLVNSSLEPLVQIVGDLRVGTPVRWVEATHPVVEHVQLAHLQPLRMREVRLSPVVRPLAVAQDAPLIAAHSSGALRLLYWGASLQESAFVLTPSFPIFVQNALRWLLPEMAFTADEQYVSSLAPAPGFYQDYAVNLDPQESLINRSGESAAAPQSVSSVFSEELLRVQIPLWHYGAWAALVFLLVEIVLYLGRPSFSLGALWRWRLSRGGR
ncbi:MAG: VWA domain-containing protein [Candidatus Bipolaricaulota bacterium]|nr:VWA domain-containing protein [Candidatus Bipolaricaulota bacterium]MDW8110033.1 VWA domain-containing protein [Candidatus Bipolaricaulota bacterium]